MKLVAYNTTTMATSPPRKCARCCAGQEEGKININGKRNANKKVRVIKITKKINEKRAISSISNLPTRFVVVLLRDHVPRIHKFGSHSAAFRTAEMVFTCPSLSFRQGT